MNYGDVFFTWISKLSIIPCIELNSVTGSSPKIKPSSDTRRICVILYKCKDDPISAAAAADFYIKIGDKLCYWKKCFIKYSPSIFIGRRCKNKVLICCVIIGVASSVILRGIECGKIFRQKILAMQISQHSTKSKNAQSFVEGTHCTPLKVNYSSIGIRDNLFIMVVFLLFVQQNFYLQFNLVGTNHIPETLLISPGVPSRNELSQALFK